MDNKRAESNQWPRRCNQTLIRQGRLLSTASHVCLLVEKAKSYCVARVYTHTHVRRSTICIYLCIRAVQLNCCGATGPQDYTYSAWFNHTRDYTGIFVPSTCCHLVVRDPRRPLVEDENLCQVQAIIHLTTDNPITQLHTQVSFAPFQWRKSGWSSG